MWMVNYHMASGANPRVYTLLAEVQLCMSHVGICCTDIHFWLHGGMGECITRSPYVPGHEGAGVVSKLGEGVTHFKLGRYGTPWSN